MCAVGVKVPVPFYWMACRARSSTVCIHYFRPAATKKRNIFEISRPHAQPLKHNRAGTSLLAVGILERSSTGRQRHSRFLDTSAP
jgi:hypothetical protein